MAKKITRPGYTNANERVFNAPGQLFNIEEKPAFRILKQLPPVGPANPPDLIPDGTQNRRNFDDFVPFVSEAAAPTVVKRIVVVGNFSGVRSARILHQYLVNFWSDPDVLAVLNNPPPIVYSREVLAQMYKDFLLFNYLPSNLTPDEPSFVEIVQPTGIFPVEIGLVPTVPITEIPEDEPLLPVTAPFGEVLTPFCQLVQSRNVRSS